MGIAKPYEFEKGTLGAPPTRGRLDVDASMKAFIAPVDGGLEMGGHRLSVAQHEEPTEVARRLRERLTARLYARRPDADVHTWSSFTRLVQGMLRDGESVEAIEPSLLEAIDGL